ncbi:MAG: hypothetical protein E7A72_10050 [Actinomyces urogenitalis]|uniref:hypothetical protein n=1 Tax=Actinomyces urogenitalis TaxID=103621 RepID=UPI0009D6D886|nr:hypothetical protein [Actinomyces urogenitalis]MDK8834603.1 hypothetical protein [Actinomyces urogenitalis]MDU0865232.1 hypothetical protein [Actinomyces urogenitalis]MDU0875685.1 hypothetical protein [Actinomyces urogenitalis]MDU0973214.1 hypothetical protein [Actinomyces urogenitalis]MDU1565385.1 hypothetical protein [Actinomyces urogenitalis]
MPRSCQVLLKEGVDDAVTYVAQRWPREVRPTLRSRIGTYLLYHRKAAPGDAGAPPAPTLSARSHEPLGRP